MTRPPARLVRVDGVARELARELRKSRRICRRSIARCRLVRNRSTGSSRRRVDAKVAMDVVTFMAPLWRLAGNPAFEQSQQLHLRSARGRGPAAEVRGRSRTAARAGNTCAARVRLGGPAGEVLLSQETHRVALAINSFSTPPGGVTLRLVDVGPGTTRCGV